MFNRDGGSTELHKQLYLHIFNKVLACRGKTIIQSFSVIEL